MSDSDWTIDVRRVYDPPDPDPDDKHPQRTPHQAQRPPPARAEPALGSYLLQPGRLDAGQSTTAAGPDG